MYCVDRNLRWQSRPQWFSQQTLWTICLEHKWTHPYWLRLKIHFFSPIPVVSCRVPVGHLTRNAFNGQSRQFAVSRIWWSILLHLFEVCPLVWLATIWPVQKQSRNITLKCDNFMVCKYIKLSQFITTLCLNYLFPWSLFESMNFNDPILTYA